MTESALYPIAAALAEGLRTARYGLFEAEVSTELRTFDNLEDLAKAIHAERRGRGLEVRDLRALTWGAAPDETRPATDVLLTSKAGEQQVLTAVLHAERAGHLWQALIATRPTRRAAA